MAPHSTVLAWRIPGTGEPGGLPSVGLQSRTRLKRLSSSSSNSRLYPVKLLCPWDSPSKNTGVGCHTLLQGIFPTQGSNLGLLYGRQTLYHLSHQGSPKSMLLLLLLSRFSRVRLCATPETAAHEAPPSLGFSRQEHWIGLPFPSPMHESEK